MLDGHVPGAALVVVKDEVAVGEGPPLRVLTREADGCPLGEEARERESFCLRPVDAALLAERVPPPLERLHQLRMDDEAVGNRDQLLVELPEAVGLPPPLRPGI